MCRLLVDAMIWNYVGKARVLSGFLASLPAIPITSVEVVDQLRPALGRWPELGAIVTAVENGEIDSIELDQEEEESRIALLTQFPGLGVVDCGLLAVASRRQWTLLTCDQALRKAAVRIGIDAVDFAQLVDEAVSKGCMSASDQSWVLAFSRGHTGHRDS